MKRFFCVGLVVAGMLWPLGGCQSSLNREQEIALGEQNAPKFSQQGGGPIPDARVQQYVDSLGRRLLAQLDPKQRRDLPWQFYTLNSPILNAFALPGGKVFVTRGLMEQMDSEAALAGVIGHEIGHVVAEHIGKQMSQARGAQVLSSILGAATDSQWAETLGAAGGKLYLLRYGRSQELEADGYGMEFMSRAGYDPAAMIRVMKVLKAGGSGGMEMLSTHPDPDHRIAQAQQFLETKYASTRNNPNYKLNREEYQGILAQLKSLPPAAKKQGK